MLNSIKHNREEGFTLMELLIVIGVIGVLTAIAFPLFINQQREAALASLKFDVKNTASGVITYVLGNEEATQTDLQNNVVPVLSNDNIISITGNAQNFLVCGETQYGDNWAYSNVVGVLDDCTLNQVPPTE